MPTRAAKQVFNIISRGQPTPYVSQEDTRRVIEELREKLKALVGGAELDSLVNRIDAYMLGVLVGCASEDASADRAVLEALSECLVKSSLAREAKLEEFEGGHMITVTGITWGALAQPDARFDDALEELMQRLAELATGKGYRVEVTRSTSRAVFRFTCGSS